MKPMYTRYPIQNTPDDSPYTTTILGHLHHPGNIAGDLSKQLPAASYCRYRSSRVKVVKDWRGEKP